MEYLSLPDFLLQHGFIAPSELNIDVSFVSGKIYYYLDQKKKKKSSCAEQHIIFKSAQNKLRIKY